MSTLPIAGPQAVASTQAEIDALKARLEAVRAKRSMDPNTVEAINIADRLLAVMTGPMAKLKNDADFNFVRAATGI